MFVALEKPENFFFDLISRGDPALVSQKILRTAYRIFRHVYFFNFIAVFQHLNGHKLLGFQLVNGFVDRFFLPNVRIVRSVSFIDLGWTQSDPPFGVHLLCAALVILFEQLLQNFTAKFFGLTVHGTLPFRSAYPLFSALTTE